MCILYKQKRKYSDFYKLEFFKSLKVEYFFYCYND